jgi:hypothetical protein
MRWQQPKKQECGAACSSGRFAPSCACWATPYDGSEASLRGLAEQVLMIAFRPVEARTHHPGDSHDHRNAAV